MVEKSRTLLCQLILLLSTCNESRCSFSASAFSMTRGSKTTPRHNILIVGEDDITRTSSARHKTSLLTPLFLSSSDNAIESRQIGEEVVGQNNNNQVASTPIDEAEKLRERARKLRLEATAAEQNLRSITQQKKESEKKEADEWINVLLGVTVTGGSYVSSERSEEGGGGVAEDEKIKVTTPSKKSLPSAQTLALRIKENQLGFQKLQKIMERLHERETSMLMGPEGYLSKQETSLDGGKGGGGGGGAFILGDYENNSNEYKKEETDRISGLLDRTLEAVEILDEDGLSAEESANGKSTKLAPKLRVRVTDLRQSRDALFQRRVDSLSASITNSKSAGRKKNSIDAYVNRSIDGEDEDKEGKRTKEEKMMARLLETPAWMPPSLASFAATSPVEVSLSHWKMIKSDLLVDSGYMCTSWDCTDVAAIFRGSMPRAYRKKKTSSSPEIDGDDEEQIDNSIATVFEDLQERLKNHPELNDRVRLFVVYDYEWRPSFDNSMAIGRRQGGWDDSEQNTPPPVIIALAKEVEPEQELERDLGTKSLAAFSTVCSILTTFTYGLSAYALNPAFFQSVVKENDITAVPLCFPIFFGVLAISALHEVGHFVAAKRYDVKLGLPVPIPSLQVGAFGSITPLRSFPSTRTALFDVALSGPGLSMLVSMALLASGLVLTISAQSIAAFPIVPAATMKSSFLVGSIVSVVAPKMMMVPLSQPVPIHPAFLVGLAGILMSAVNLLPIGRLDGGRASMSAWGRRAASLISFLSLLVLAFYSFSGFSGIIAFWGAIVVLTQRLPDIPAVDEVTGVGDLRVNSYLALLSLALLALLPFPGGVGPI